MAGGGLNEMHAFNGKAEGQSPPAHFTLQTALKFWLTWAVGILYHNPRGLKGKPA